ncbi:PIN-like domain-containing protein [Streptomyces sp. NRRL WC-3742]|uniref:PIN-like domain-containing protein n=1 Tax=Streptomyces sp. NRRL WC-3742 TaxID=1463934 RepID=UPI000AD4DB51|nr:PIN-like domain-containing protein [Streptomyces sp. NRRL WC-3742]
MGQADLPLVEQFRSWILPGGGAGADDRRAFFEDALVVLDTNVLLSLYEYNPAVRNQVLSALAQISKRLWLPYQVGQEFVRGRRRVIIERSKELGDAPVIIDRHLQQASKAVLDASAHVKRLLGKYANDDAAQSSLDEAINQATVKELLAEWQEVLKKHAKQLKSGHDLLPAAVESDDPVLPEVAALFEDRLAPPTDYPVVHRRLEEALTFRFPNEIPPGFADAGKKGKPLDQVGDYLVWAEILDKAADPGVKRVLLVSADSKKDWYEDLDGRGGKRPWPQLFEEMRQRTGAELRIEQPGQFFQGIEEFLAPSMELTTATYDEIDRAFEAVAQRSVGTAPAVTDDNAHVVTPPDGLALEAYRAADLTTRTVRQFAQSERHRHFQWWLIGVTAELGHRVPADDEPLVELFAAVRSEVRPAPEWYPGTVLAQGEWPYRSDSWVAPWFVQLVREAGETDRRPLQRLAARQMQPRA